MTNCKELAGKGRKKSENTYRRMQQKPNVLCNRVSDDNQGSGLYDVQDTVLCLSDLLFSL